ncbi:MAG: TetR/AcrR family transcriptional regulator [bacterium]
MPTDNTSTHIPKQKRGIQTRAAILDAGERLFSRDGYHATSTKKIAREAGTSVGSYYNYFPDKKALLIEVYQQHVTKVHGMVLDTLSAADFGNPAASGSELTRLIIDHAVRLHTLSADFHKEIEMLRYSDPDIQALAAQQEQRVVEGLASLLEPHRESLRVDDLQAASLVVVSAVEAVVHSLKMFEAPMEDERIIDALADMIHSFLFA